MIVTLETSKKEFTKGEGELKSCPICNGKVRVTDKVEHRLYVEKPKFCVQCISCDLLFGYDPDYGGEFATKEEAIEVWNRRANDER